MKHFSLFMILLALALFCGCQMDHNIQETDATEGITSLNLSLSSLSSFSSKTYMGSSEDGKRKVYWSNGDQVCLNGVVSDALSGLADKSSSAVFNFSGAISSPYNLLYPASFYKDGSTITLPSEQSFAEGTFASGAAPLAAYSDSGEESLTLAHLCSYIRLSVTKDANVSQSSLVSVKFKGNSGEQVCGDFTIDYSAGTLTAAGEGAVMTLNVNQAIGASPIDLYLVVPARTYSDGFTIELEDNLHRKMTKVKDSATTLEAGKLVKMTEFSFVPSPIASSLTIDELTEEVLAPDGYNINGRVVDSSNNGIAGVVVSDGTQCVRTMFDGSFYMTSTIADVKFVYISTPSGYLPTVSGGIPRFYKLLSDYSPSGGVYNVGDFVLSPVANPDRFTLLITADPQPRPYNKWNNDRIAFKSLDACEDLYDELQYVASNITDRQVYGICLGDVVHEDMSLFSNYDNGLARLGYPTYNIIGNHDNDPDAADDDASAAPYESHYGPRNYSFNIGGIHFVMLDNLIMKDKSGKLTGFDQGLTDRAWAWLQADLSYIPTSTKLMVCAHSPMFKQINGSERTNTALHGGNDGYGGLINKYTEVHAWAGHTHIGFNYNYPSTHRHKRVQVHTLARSTGELWTNEYLAGGTPRGFTIVDVDNGTITWKFHPNPRQTGLFDGINSGICSAGPPAYTWRDWDYNSSGVAVMRNGGGALTEDYQMHVYPRGAYGDNYVYANVFLWDSRWEKPVWTPTGGTPVEMSLMNDETTDILVMPQIDTLKIHDLANTEIKTHYKAKVGFLKTDDDYPASEVGEITTLFRAPADATPSSGTITVTDRFGNTYSRSVSW